MKPGESLAHRFLASEFLPALLRVPGFPALTNFDFSASTFAFP
jgi:hypothetical protein